MHNRKQKYSFIFIKLNQINKKKKEKLKILFAATGFSLRTPRKLKFNFE